MNKYNLKCPYCGESFNPDDDLNHAYDKALDNVIKLIEFEAMYFDKVGVRVAERIIKQIKIKLSVRSDKNK